MIEVRLGELADADTAAILVPVDANASAVTRAGRRVQMRAGAAVLERSLRLGELPVGSAILTEAGDLPGEFLIHVVVRAFDEPVSEGSVRRALRNGLRRSAEWGIESVAMPLLGTGAANLDAERAAQVMLPVLLEHWREAQRPSRVLIVADSAYEREAMTRALANAVPADPS